MSAAEKAQLEAEADAIRARIEPEKDPKARAWLKAQFGERLKHIEARLDDEAAKVAPPPPSPPEPLGA